jgi:HD-GYP domain-containing protein (c-di-GMP phosphodiesterase class II)
MLETLVQYQQNLMLMLSAVCGTVALFVVITKTIPKKRRGRLLFLELTAMLLLMADRLAYFYRGNVTNVGWWMVRISNFSVFFLSLVILLIYNLYLRDLFTTEGGIAKLTVRLRIVEILLIIGMLMILLSQFYGFYYTFDANNRYQRGPLFYLSYIVPTLSMVLQLSVILQYYKYLSSWIRASLLLFTVVPMVASLLQIKLYGLSLTNMSIVGMAVFLYVLSLVDMNHQVEQAHKLKIEFLMEEQKSMRRLFEQTATALASAIDAKDTYTHGHSTRVADYSRMIAKQSGMDEKECNEVYYAALLHDVGKIGIPNEIINKKGKLTPEEYAMIQKHPVIGKQILSSIVEFPYLSIGANSHHERYDGKGYPDKLKGEDIPRLARIIAVADAYDAMTSKRSYRDPMPQQQVREELIRGLGEQFDPEYAKIMIHLLDMDTEYEMKEREDVKELAGNDELQVEKYRSYVSEGIWITQKLIKLHLEVSPLEGHTAEEAFGAILLFDSLDGRAHAGERQAAELCYYEYGEIWLDGRAECPGIRKMETKVTKLEKKTNAKERDGKNQSVKAYDIEVVKWLDHVRLIIYDGEQVTERILALPDSARYTYLGLTGQYCHINGISITRSEKDITEDAIPRIAEMVSYANGPVGDLPNIQIDGYRTASTKGIPIVNGMKISFHAMSLPTARLIWHIPFISVFSSEDGQIDGPSFHEYALIRIDGEYWDSGIYASNKLTVDKKEEFAGWDDWKRRNKEGIDCVVSFHVEGDQITVYTENLGISVKNVVTILDGSTTAYAALSGDQVALTDIHII